MAKKIQASESGIELLSGQRHPDETDLAVIACNDYLRLGVRRSLYKLLQRYQTVPNFSTQRLPTLKMWSSRFEWQKRASEYDAQWEQRKNEEREAAFNEGLALDFERVERLKQLAYFLEGQIYAQDKDGVFYNVWLTDVKGIGSDEDYERVEIERFNPAILEQYRKVLEDIAKETGGRVQRQELSGANGGPLLIEYINDWRANDDNDT